jgi:hypothetical protein
MTLASACSEPFPLFLTSLSLALWFSWRGTNFGILEGAGRKFGLLWELMIGWSEVVNGEESGVVVALDLESHKMSR